MTAKKSAPKADPITVCLGHDIRTDKPSCPKSNNCARHLALRAKKFPDNAPLMGAACSNFDYVLFMPAQGAAS